MKRECTQAENHIIKESGPDVLTRPDTYNSRFNSIIMPTIFGAIVGMGIGALVSLAIPVKNAFAIRFILFIFVTITVELLVLFWEICGRRKKAKKHIPGDRFWVNGGTIINYVNSKEGAYLIFAEDELRDSMGNPCCIAYPAPYGMNVRYGERIILVYSDTGAYIPLRVTGRTQYFIYDRVPEYFYKVNWNEATCLPHPAVMDTDKESFVMNENEAANVVKKCNSIKSIRIRNWIGIVLSSFLILFLSALSFIFLVAGDVITEFSTAVIFVIAVVLIWLFLTYIIARTILAGKVRRLTKIRYKKKVLFHSVNDVYENNMYMKYVSVYEYVNGVLELVSYPSTGNVFLPKNIPYGKIIYKYSKDAKSCARDLNFFM